MTNLRPNHDWDKALTTKPEGPDTVRCDWCREIANIDDTIEVHEGRRVLFLCRGRCEAEFNIDRQEANSDGID